jgi:hypothetical protein
MTDEVTRQDTGDFRERSSSGSSSAPITIINPPKSAFEIFLAGQGGRELTSQEIARIKAQTARLGSQTTLEREMLKFQKDKQESDADLQRQSMDLSRQIRTGELSLAQATARMDAVYKEQVLKQNERIAQSQALARAHQAELAAAPYRLPAGTKYFPGFEPTGLAAQLAEKYGFNFQAQEVAPIDFDPKRDIQELFRGSLDSISIPDYVGAGGEVPPSGGGGSAFTGQVGTLTEGEDLGLPPPSSLGGPSEQELGRGFGESGPSLSGPVNLPTGSGPGSGRSLTDRGEQAFLEGVNGIPQPIIQALPSDPRGSYIGSETDQDRAARHDRETSFHNTRRGEKAFLEGVGVQGKFVPPKEDPLDLERRMREAKRR